MKKAVSESNRYRIVGQAILSVVILGMVMVPGLARAAKVTIEPPSLKIPVGQTVNADVFLDTEDESINAVGGRLAFNPADAEVIEVRTGDSLINFWLANPQASSAGNVEFSGIIPGGFNGNGKLFSIKLKAKREGKAEVKLADFQVLKNDGQGSPADAKVAGLLVEITKPEPSDGTAPPEEKDTQAPLAFIPQVVKDKNLFGGKWFLVFATQDKQSGMDHYEVAEQTNSWDGDLDKLRWETATSSYLLKDQKLESYIYVKAVDRQGNYQLATVTPAKPPAWYKSWTFWAVTALALVIVGFMIWDVEEEEEESREEGVE